MTYMCPVCGYNQLDEPPQDYLICPSCGTEFGNDDTLYTYRDLEKKWANSGYLWFSAYTHAPEGWNPIKQLENLNARETSEETLHIKPVGVTTSEDLPVIYSDEIAAHYGDDYELGIYTVSFRNTRIKSVTATVF